MTRFIHFLFCQPNAETEPLLSVEHAHSSLFKRFADWSINLLASTGTLGTAVYYNCIRDLTWTYLTYDQFGYNFKENKAWTEEDYTQWAYSTGAMLVAMILHILACRAAHRDMPYANTIIAIFAASLAIPGWNIAGRLGQQWGRNIGLSDTAAGYFAGLFTGLAEGPIQEAAGSLGNLVHNLYTGKETLKNISDHLSGYTTDFAKRFLFSILPGCVPGDVWQWIYNAGATNNLGASATSTLVTTGVVISNVFYDKAKTAALFKSPSPVTNEEINLSSAPTLVIN